MNVHTLLMNVNYPIKKIDEVLNSLRDSKYFCKLDLFKAYLHLQTDEESSIIQTISTHRGTYKMNRLSFGIKTALAEFNRVIDQILNGLPKTIAYFDDIVVHGKTKDQCSRNLFACLERLREYDLHWNIKKCTFFQTRIEYLGHVVENNKISRSPSKVEAIIRMQQPRNVQELRQFLGMVTYFSRFIPDVSTITYPLRKLLRKNQKFYWNKECQQAFLKLKEEISSDRVLVPFDPELPVTLATDASPVGVAAVLSHIVDNVETPVAFASRSLTEAERNYSQLDRESLAIIFGVSHFMNYIYGQYFVLITDNQPLSRIFHPKTGFPKMTSARLLRYASFSAGFDYTVKFRKGLENQNVDCLSRVPVNQNCISADVSINDEVHQVRASAVFEISSENLTADAIIQEKIRSWHRSNENFYQVQ
ncbi:Retrovirus-related Pol polyprotein from transposon 17.6 [Araneus ventricosus]|uniref:Retrovirus-related Pol polyprotein from transposon 17.6 n=1 Tax=Araneus ventricosus TaxID=182803 RepID=A0A4Y2RL96_ARAVE|nr:Retrovirus-related Pol polyprotein from transposon 17.6 [Araneus ventricosus]